MKPINPQVRHGSGASAHVAGLKPATAEHLAVRRQGSGAAAANPSVKAAGHPVKGLTTRQQGSGRAARVPD